MILNHVAGWLTASRLTFDRLRTASRLISTIGLALLSGLSNAPTAVAVTISDIVTFDSSLSDTGNAFALSGGPGAPYVGGRATNGPVWVEQLATLLGVPVPTASVLGGSNYAFSGAEAGPGFKNVGWQVDQYLGGHTPRPSDLFVLSGGQNNFSNGEFDPAVPAAYMADHIATLASAGAANFVVLNILPIGEVPAFNFAPPEEADYFNQLAAGFNAEFAARVDDLRASLSINIVLVDWHGLVESIIADPGAFGLTNVDDPAFNGATVVSNPEDYLFWDYLHPTTAAHGILASAAYAGVQQSILSQTWIVPEPATSLMLVMGVAALIGVAERRRRKRRR